MEVDSEMTEDIDENEFILNHVVLPRFLPQKNQNYNDQLKIIKRMLKNVRDLRSYLPINTVHLCETLKNIHLQSTDDNLRDTIKKELRYLLAGDTFAIFVRGQNCTLIVHKKAASLILATFHGDVNSNEIYSQDSDLQVTKCIYGSKKSNKVD